MYIHMYEIFSSSCWPQRLAADHFDRLVYAYIRFAPFLHLPGFMTVPGTLKIFIVRRCLGVGRGEETTTPTVPPAFFLGKPTE